MGPPRATWSLGTWPSKGTNPTPSPFGSTPQTWRRTWQTPQSTTLGQRRPQGTRPIGSIWATRTLVWNYGKDTELPLKANTWHHLTHTYEGVGGYRTLYLDGRKVESAYAGDTAGRFPPLDMTGYSQDGYAVSASGEYADGGDSNHRMWRPFQDPLSGDGSWLTDDSPATFDNTSPNSAATSANSLNGIVGVSGSRNGPWLKLDLPHKIKFSYAHIYMRNHPSIFQRIKTGYIYGSNDDSTWTTIGIISESSPSYTVTSPLIVTTTDTTNAYKYIVLQVTLIDAQSATFGLGRLRYFGHKENDLIRFPDATNVRKYPDTAMTFKRTTEGVHGDVKGGSVMI